MADRMAFDDSIDDRVIYLAYRLILGRPPESDDAYAHYRAVSHVDQLRAIFAGSFEFRAQSWARLAEFRASRFCAEYEADVAAGVRARGDDRIRIVQTADTQKYAEMLRQSARTVHFIVSWLLLFFLIVHVTMVALSGFWRRVRAMITGHAQNTEEAP